MTMRSLFILFGICLSANAFAQDALPKVGNKPLVQVKPKEPLGCKLVGDQAMGWGLRGVGA
jgi:hypothetical protein